MSEALLPEGQYTGTIRRAFKEELSDGGEVLFVELELLGPDGVPHTVHDVIGTQARLDQFLASFGFSAGSMRLRGKEGER